MCKYHKRIQLVTMMMLHTYAVRELAYFNEQCLNCQNNFIYAPSNPIMFSSYI